MKHSIEAVMNNENLSTAQKEVILDANDADIKMMNALIEMETSIIIEIYYSIKK